MVSVECAVVNYLPGELGGFIDGLRRRFDPALADWLAHVTLLPPRPLAAPLEDPLEALRSACALMEPFEVSLGAVSTFRPTSDVVYLAVTEGAERLAQLHDALNSGPLAHQERYSFVPHVTIAQEVNERDKDDIMAQVGLEWSRYGANASFEVESLVFVQKTSENRWLNLASVRLGNRLTRSHAYGIKGIKGL